MVDEIDCFQYFGWNIQKFKSYHELLIIVIHTFDICVKVVPFVHVFILAIILELCINYGVINSRQSTVSFSYQ